jgi:hypothetical protein
MTFDSTAAVTVFNDRFQNYSDRNEPKHGYKDLVLMLLLYF